jgi:hypothetical protein
VVRIIVHIFNAVYLKKHTHTHTHTHTMQNPKRKVWTHIKIVHIFNAINPKIKKDRAPNPKIHGRLWHKLIF